MSSQEAAQYTMLFFIFALTVSWFTGQEFADSTLVKGAAMLVKIPFLMGGMIKNSVGGDLGAMGAYLFFVVIAFPTLRSMVGESIYTFVIVATVSSIVLGTFF